VKYLYKRTLAGVTVSLIFFRFEFNGMTNRKQTEKKKKKRKKKKKKKEKGINEYERQTRKHPRQEREGRCLFYLLFP